jgi:endonuclease/exonuclease/phosphatase family metal-dependent hydrolase
VFTDAWAVRGEGRGCTFSEHNPHLANATWPNRRIDYVLVSWPRPKPRGSVRSCRLAGIEPVDGVVASDHYAVVAELIV